MKTNLGLDSHCHSRLGLVSVGHLLFGLDDTLLPQLFLLGDHHWVAPGSWGDVLGPVHVGQEVLEALERLLRRGLLASRSASDLLGLLFVALVDLKQLIVGFLVVTASQSLFQALNTNTHISVRF